MTNINFHQRSANSFYNLARPIPVLENRLTQMQAGPSDFSTDLLATERTVFLHRNTNPSCTLFSAFDPRFCAVSVPLSWQGDYIINGRRIDQSDIYISAGTDGVFSRFEKLDQITIGIEKQSFVDSVAALQGVAPEKIRLDDDILKLAGRQKKLFVRLLMSIYKRYSKEQASNIPAAFDAEIQTLIATFYQFSTKTDDVRCQIYWPKRIVRRAEDRFEEANWAAVSIADLCAAAGVSERTLHRAFHSIYGDAPKAYFGKRRLAHARSILLESEPMRGRVTHAALSAGLTELGRFSVQYRQLYGVTPSATHSG